MSQNNAELRRLLDGIFEDSFVEPAERRDLAALRAGISDADVRATFRRFLADKWGEAMADDVVTGPERALLARIVSELGLTFEDLPHQMQVALREHLHI